MKVVKMDEMGPTILSFRLFFNISFFFPVFGCSARLLPTKTAEWDGFSQDPQSHKMAMAMVGGPFRRTEGTSPKQPAQLFSWKNWLQKKSPKQPACYHLRLSQSARRKRQLRPYYRPYQHPKHSKPRPWEAPHSRAAASQPSTLGRASW